jgi:hypothetical protein
MSFLRFAALLLLGVWIGGLVALGGIAAPSIFSVLEGLDPPSGRDTAGRVFGAVFEQFQRFSWVLGAILLLLLMARRILGPPPRRFNLRVAALALMLAVSLITSFVVAPRIADIRDGTPGGVSALAPDDSRRLEFGRLHGLTSGLMVIALLTGVALFWAETRDVH